MIHNGRESNLIRVILCKKTGRPWSDNRKILNGVLWISRTGAPWRALPEYYGPWQTVYKCFSQWQKNEKLKISVTIRICRGYASTKPISKRIEPVQVIKRATGDDYHQNIGISWGGRTIKIHGVVDGLGYPLVLELSDGQVHDEIMLQKCLKQLGISGSTVLADKAYGLWENRAYIAAHDADFCISPKINAVDPRYCDYPHYKERHFVECFFMRIKDCRRIAMRFEKIACRYLAFLHLAAALRCLA